METEEERPQQAQKEDGSGREGGVRRHASSHAPPEKCPRCDSMNTKFCYYNNYSLSQPRHFCKNCKRYWTKGGALRNVPFGGGCRRGKRSRTSSSYGGDNLQEPPALPLPFPPMVQLFHPNQQHQLMLGNTHSMTAAIALAAAGQMARPSTYYNSAADGVGVGGVGGNEEGGYHGSYSGVGASIDLQASAAVSGSTPSYHRLPPLSGFTYQHPQPRQREQWKQCSNDEAGGASAAPSLAMPTTRMAGLSPMASSRLEWQQIAALTTPATTTTNNSNCNNLAALFQSTTTSTVSSNPVVEVGSWNMRSIGSSGEGVHRPSSSPSPYK